MEQDWFNIFMRLKSSLVRCPYCGEGIFLESNKATVCPNCKKTIKAVGYLKFDKRSNQTVAVPIFKDAVLYDYHMNSSSEDFETAAAVILEKPGKFGLKNNSRFNWSVKTPEGKIISRQPGEVQVLFKDAEINFGNKNIAQVVAND